MSPRPKKIRRCEGDFCERAYKPTGTPLRNLVPVHIHRDELEAMRLCDYDRLTQEEAGKRMGVSRGTVQRIVTMARSKIAGALSQGCSIILVDDEDDDE